MKTKPDVEVTNRAGIDKCGLVIALLLGVQVCSVRAQGETNAPYPLPEEYKLAEAAAANVAKSKVSPDLKNEVASEFQGIKSEFSQVWTPVQDAYAQYLRNIHAWKLEIADHNTEAKIHNKKKHVFRSDSELAAYNAEKEAGDVEGKNLQRKGAQIDNDAKAEIAKKREAVDAWANTKLRKFNELAQDVLDGKHKYNDGLAKHQLEESAKGKANADAVISGSRKFSSASVGATGEKVLTPEERKKLQELPSAQRPRGFRTTAPPPPPPGQ